MKKHIIISCLFIGILTSLIGQRPNRPNGGQRGSDQMPKLKLIGQITDGTSGQGLEFATISVYSKRDSTLVGGGMTGADGTFSVNVKPGPMYAVLDFISYESKTIDVQIDRDAIKSGKREINLGSIQLLLNSTQLDEVEIRAERSETQFSLDRKVFNVGKDLANRGGSAEDILDNVPSVTVDVEGNVSLRGSEGVKILIDGKPSSMVGIRNTNGLKNIPSNMIMQVEVITNPSAKYGAEGTAGIINIIMKKDTGHGFNGSFNAQVGVPEAAGIGANVNYRKGNLNWFANYSIRYRTGPGNGFNNSVRTVLDTMTVPFSKFNEILNSTRESDRGGLSNSIVFGADYFFNEKEQLTAKLNYRISDDYSLNVIMYDSLLEKPINTIQKKLSRTIRTDDESEDETNLEYSLNYRKTLSKRDHYLNAQLSYRDQSEIEGSDFDELITPEGGIETPNLIQEARNDEGEQTWLFEVDYSKPLGKDHKYEFGMSTSIRQIGNDYTVLEQNSEGQLLPLVLRGEVFDNEFSYDENIYRLYGSYGNKLGNFNYNAVLGAEYTDVETIESNSNSSNPRTYFDLFPSLYLNYAQSEKTAFQISYSRRIQRPRFFYLNPFFTLSDRINLFGGNPNLNPEYTNSYEIGNIQYWDKLTLSTSFFYRQTTANIQRLTELNCDGTTTRRPNNVGEADDYGLDINVSYSGLDWLRLDANGNFFNATASGTYETTNCTDLVGENVSMENFEVNNFTWFGRLTARITFLDSDLQIRGNYRGARQQAQGDRAGAGSIDLGWSKDFMNDNLTVTLSVRDILNSRVYAGTTVLTDFMNESQFRRRSRATTLAVSYRINQKKKRGGRPQGGGQDGGGEF